MTMPPSEPAKLKPFKINFADLAWESYTQGRFGSEDKYLTNNTRARKLDCALEENRTMTMHKAWIMICMCLALSAGCYSARKTVKSPAPEAVSAIQFFLVDDNSASTAPVMTDKETGELVHLLKTPIAMADMASAEVRPADYAPDIFEIVIVFTADGAQQFGALTGGNIGKRLAIVVAGELLSVPKIMDRIAGGKAILTYHFTEQQARDVAARLNAALGRR